MLHYNYGGFIPSWHSKGKKCQKSAIFRTTCSASIHFCKGILCRKWNELSYKLILVQIFFIAGQTMGCRSQTYLKIEPIIATLNLILNVFIDFFIVISL